MTKLPAITKENTTYANDDLMYGVDISDVTDDPTGSSFRTQYNDLRNEVLKTHVVTPQMFGAVGDRIADDSVAVQDAADACNALNNPTIVRPELYFPRAIGYRCVSTIIVKENIHVIMDADLVHDGTQSTKGLVIGTNGSGANSSVKLRLRVSRENTSDWTDEGSIGIQLISTEGSQIFASVGSLLDGTAGNGFTIGLQTIGDGTGFVNNAVTCGRFGNNKIAIDLTSRTTNGTHTGSNGEATVLTDSSQRFNLNDLVGDTITNLSDPNGGTGSTGTVTSNTATTITMSGGLSGGTANVWNNGDLYKVGNAGWCNNNEWYGGRFFCFTTTQVGVERHAHRLTGNDSPVTEDVLDANIFFHPSIECRVDCVPVLIEHGQKNRWIGCRDEGNGPVFARILHNEFGVNSSNAFNTQRSFGVPVIEEQGNAVGNFITTDNFAMAFESSREVFDSGEMHENAVFYDDTRVHVPNVHIVGSFEGQVALSLISFSVSETFTTDFATDNDKLLDTAHTRQNDDRVFLTTAGTLPNGLNLATEYFVVQRDTNDFKVSLNIGGTPVTFSDDGTGAHTYNGRNRFITVGTARGVGVEVLTDTAKNFVFTRDTDSGFEGTMRIRAFNAAGFQLQNQEDFTVDDANDELIQADHTLVVDDRITFTTTGTLPNDLNTTDDFFVISINDTAAGRFRVSATEGGSALTDLAGAAPTNTYHLEYGYVVGEPQLFWTTTHGGVYIQGNDNDLEHQFRVRDEAVRIDVLIGKGSADCHIRRFKITTTDRGVIPATQLGYDSRRNNEPLAKQSPTDGVYYLPETIWNDELTPGEATGWTLAVAGAPGIWDEVSRSTAQPETATGTISLLSSGPTSIDSSGGAVTATLGSGDYIGQMKTIVMTDASNSSTVTITLHVSGNPTVYTFAVLSETLVLMWTGEAPDAEWTTIYSTASPAGQA